MRSRGVTLLELLWALALGLAIATLVFRMMAVASRHLRDERAAAELQATVRGAIDYLGAELASLGWGSGESDILDVGPGRIRYRARRGLGLACWADPSGVVALRAGAGYGRPPVVGRDSFAILLEWDTTTTLDDAWLRLPVIGSSTGGWCPDGDSALSVATTADPRLAAGGAVRPDAPVISWEIVEVRTYLSGGESWLGEQSLTGGGVIEPAFGPMASSGFEISTVGVGGSPIYGPDDIGVVTVSMQAIARSHGGTRAPIGLPLLDSLRATFTLRNAAPLWGWP